MSYLPSAPLQGRDPIAAPRRPIGRATVDQLVAMVSAIGGMIFGVLAIPTLIQQAPQLSLAWTIPTAVFIYLGIVVIWLAALTRQFRRTFNTVFAIVFMAAVISWPLVTPADVVLDQRPWLWQLINVGTATAVVGMSAWVATVYTIGVPIAFSAITLLPSGGGLDPATAAIDAGYAVILGLAVLVMMTSYRQLGSQVDRSQAEALDGYSRAARAEAAEAERREVDMLIHDSVLTTLIAASRAEQPEERRIVARMAANALANLEHTELPRHSESATSFLKLRDRLAEAFAVIDAPVEVSTLGPMIGTMPVPAGEAIYSAALQAVQNSIRHAGGNEVERTVTMQATAEGVITITVRDTGSGFDPAMVPVERLGIRLSIIERIEAAGGEVSIRSGPGQGTAVTLVWPAQTHLLHGDSVAVADEAGQVQP
ncbi:MAG: sensor histidine kinase [Microbacteriaceae bacterium]